ncbi:MAG: hypothetical protein K0Q95_2025 [Bacteroidota bacterium]|jgi:hypothetical protein|nr:hypothetical protein [Bacteroidota bacterium]
MKKLFLLLAAPAMLILASCGGTKNEEATTTLPGMMETTINVNGNKLSIMVPDSTKGKLEVVEQSWGATEIKVGKEFQISVTEGEGDVALTKSDIAGNDVNKFKRFVKDEPTLLFWESEITQPEYHFYTIVKAGNASYVIEDIKGEIFNEKGAQTMIDAAKTLKAKDAAKPNA